MAPGGDDRENGPIREREVIMKKIIFIAVVAIAALAVILDDGRPRPRMYRHH